MGFSFSSITKSVSLAVLLCFLTFTSAEAAEKLDPSGNITITWQIISWQRDGYVAYVRMYNYQKHRDIKAPGWTLGWTWAKKEVIRSMLGAQPTNKGDCSKFKGEKFPPQSCIKDPKIVDLLPNAPFTQKIVYCCKGGVINSYGKDPKNALSAFSITVGSSGKTKKTVTVPSNFTLLAPGAKYTCGPTKIVVIEPSPFLDWRVICTYSGKPAA